MENLLKYKGRYRILAHYDMRTNDFIRDSLGNIDSSFDDYYIPCKGKAQIYHYGHDILVAYILSTQRGQNIVDKLNEINPDIVIDFEKHDGESEFKFNSKYIDIVARLMGARTSGANISPFSKKNLPKQKYLIPENDLNEYKQLINPFDLKTIGTIFNDFDRLIVEHMKEKTGTKSFDIFADKRLKMLKGKEYIHSIGMWDEFIVFIKNNLE